MSQPRVQRFVSGFFAWEVIMVTPYFVKLVVEFFKPNAMYYIAGGWAVTAIGVLGIAISLLCSGAGSLFRGLAAALVGFGIGAGLIVLVGYVLTLTGGFEAASFFAVSLILSIPSGIGGAFAGWINRQRMPTHAGT